MKKTLLLLPLLITFAGCEQDPVVSTDVVSISQPTAEPSFTSVRINYNVQLSSSYSIFMYESMASTVYYSLNSSFDEGTTQSAEAISGGYSSFVAKISDLDDASHYYYKIRVYNDASYAEFGPYEFTTRGISAPSLGAVTVTQIGYSTAQFSSFVSYNGGAEITEYGFCWGTSPNPTLETNTGHVTLDPSHPLTSTPTTLVGGTTYYVRSYARNTKAIGYGNDATFTTIAYSEPVVVTNSTSSSDISYTSATLSGSVSSAGSESIVNRGFYYSTSLDPSHTGQKANADGTGLGSFSRTINGLQSGTTYYYCAYAVNSQGIEGLGQVKAFTTK